MQLSEALLGHLSGPADTASGWVVPFTRRRPIRNGQFLQEFVLSQILLCALYLNSGLHSVHFINLSPNSLQICKDV